MSTRKPCGTEKITFKCYSASPSITLQAFNWKQWVMKSLQDMGIKPLYKPQMHLYLSAWRWTSCCTLPLERSSPYGTTVPLYAWCNSTCQQLARIDDLREVKNTGGLPQMSVLPNPLHHTSFPKGPALAVFSCAEARNHCESKLLPWKNCTSCI